MFVCFFLDRTQKYNADLFLGFSAWRFEISFWLGPWELPGLRVLCDLLSSRLEIRETRNLPSLPWICERWASTCSRGDQGWGANNPPPPNFVDISFQLFLRETMHKGTKVHFAVFDFHRGIAHVTSGTEGPVRPPFLQRAIRESHRRCAQHVQHLHFVSDITRRPRGLWQNWLPCVHGNLFRFLVK